MNVASQASNASQAVTVESENVAPTAEEVLGYVSRFLDGPQISSISKIDLCSRLISTVNQHVHIKALPHSDNQNNSTADPVWHNMLENRQKIVESLNVSAHLPSLLGDRVLTTEEYLLLKGLVQNFSVAQTDLLLNILVTKDCYVHESLVDYFKSEKDLRCFVSLF